MATSTTEKSLKELKAEIIEANAAYRAGDPYMSDSEFDDLIDELMELAPNDELLTKIGIAPVDETRKRKLPIRMASMNKIKTIEEFKTWLRLKKIPDNEILIATGKYDGIALCCVESSGETITRGDGIFGQLSTEHMKLLDPKRTKRSFISFGEGIMSRKNFNEKYR